MNTAGTDVPGAARDSAAPDVRAEPAVAMAKTPYWLLWSSGIVAFVLCAAAFLFWGMSGASTLFDMIVALCT